MRSLQNVSEERTVPVTAGNNLGILHKKAGRFRGYSEMAGLLIDKKLVSFYIVIWATALP